MKIRRILCCCTALLLLVLTLAACTGGGGGGRDGHVLRTRQHVFRGVAAQRGEEH